MKNIIHYNAMLTHLNRLLKDSASKITLNELIVLESLKILEGCRKDLPSFTGKDSSHILRTLNTLHKRGLIIKSRSFCHLTSEGEAVLRESKLISDFTLKKFSRIR